MTTLPKQPYALPDVSECDGRAFYEHPCESAEEMLWVLTPGAGLPWTHGFREASAERWVFRGQARADWGLVPAAHRTEVEEAHEYHVLTRWAGRNHVGWKADARWLASTEQSLVYSFAAGADRLALALPWDSDDLRTPQRKLEFTDFPPRNQRPLFGLAQHFGVPTRLLDWSWSPIVASYFAAKSALGESELDEHGALAVWALSYDFLLGWPLTCPLVEVVLPPYFGNPNIHAQRGLFTLVTSCCIADELPPRVDELVQNLATPPSLPPLIKVTLSYEHARRLLYLLSMQGTNAASITPGHAGVVEWMKEQNLYHRSRRS